VIGRQIVGGVAGLGAMSLFAAGLIWSGSPHRGPPGHYQTLTLVERLNTERPADRRWTVTHAVSFNRVMVVDVATHQPAQARTIAPMIVGPVRPLKYDEILIYFRATSDRRAPAERRVQWTPGGGYTEMVIRDSRLVIR
jgi:hypothetical protein